MDRDRDGRWCSRINALRLVIKQYQDCRFWLYHRAMAALPIQLDRARKTPLAAQIYSAIREGIENGRLTSGARLPRTLRLCSKVRCAILSANCSIDTPAVVQQTFAWLSTSLLKGMSREGE